MDHIELTPEVEVQLDVFSGRQNPRWTLSADRARELQALLQGLEPTERREPPGLGYRGFVLTARDGTLRAFESVLSITFDDRTAYFRDVRGLEELLLVQARDHGYGDLIETFRAAEEPQQSEREP